MIHSNLKPHEPMIPDGQTRKKIFYWLKQVSSHTAWRRIFEFYREWSEVAEKSVRDASTRGWLVTYNAQGDVSGGVPETQVYEGIPSVKFRGSSISEKDYVDILNGLAHCEEGVFRLIHGDKQVFKYATSGEFPMAFREIESWTSKLGGRSEVEIDLKYTPNWTEFVESLGKLTAAWGECSAVILESQWAEDAAPNIYGTWLQEQLPKMHFPEDLGDVPDPTDNLLVPTGEVIPVSGIWEPVEARKEQGFSLFKKARDSSGPFQVSGCMNYLHAGSLAPKAGLETHDDNYEIDTTWRLLWLDDRYADGTVPIEESRYVFVEPIEQPGERVSGKIPVAAELLVCRGGEPAPRAGRWALSSDSLAHVRVAQGEPLPKHDDPRAVWVWTQQQE